MTPSVAPTASGADAAAALRRALRRSGRREQLRAAALVLPLFLFLLLTFIAPIGAMLGRAFFDREVAEIMPRVTAELARWDGARSAARRRLRGADRGCPGRARGRHARQRGHAAQLRRRGIPVAALRDGPAARRRRRGLAARDPECDRSEVERPRDLGGDSSRGGTGHRFLPARGAGPAARRKRGDHRDPAGAGGVSQRARAHAVDLRRRDARLPAAGLSRRVLHRATATRARRHAALSRAASVLDFAAGSHGCLGGPAAARRHPQQSVSCRSGSSASRCG